MTKIELDLEGIKRYIKIRHPVLMLDKAVVTPGVCADGYKLLDINEEFWQGHYPGYPLMPGTYQLEALSQLFSLTFLLQNEYQNIIPKLVGFDNVRFYKEVDPNGTENKLEMSAQLNSFRHGLAKGTARAMIGPEIVCSAEIKTMIRIS